MDIILLFLAKPLDKHGTTLVHITYPPLEFMLRSFRDRTSREPVIGTSNSSNLYCAIDIFYLFGRLGRTMPDINDTEHDQPANLFFVRDDVIKNLEKNS